jgi:hypothetical protein
VCIKPAHFFFFFLGCIWPAHKWRQFCLPQILQLYLFTAPLTWNVSSFEKHTWRRKSGDASSVPSMSTAKFVCAIWSLSFSAWIMWIFYATLRRSRLCSTLCTVECGICSCKLAAQIDLRRICWSASPMWSIFSSEVHVFQEISHSTDYMSSQNQMLLYVGGWCPHCVLKLCRIAIRDCNSAIHNTHWTCSCGVDTVSEPIEGQQLAHVRGSGMGKKNLKSFPSVDVI